MGRLCERPGCSENAALTYGMRPEDLVFWIDLLREGVAAEVGVLCLRHGDTMTVPRGWTLDDLRDPDLHLFRPPPRPDGPATRRNRPRRRTNDDTGQLALGGLVEEIDEPESTEGADTVGVPEPVGDAGSVSVESSDPVEPSAAVSPPTESAVPTEVAVPTELDPVSEPAEGIDVAEVPPDAAGGEERELPVELNWKPAFDDGDDLDGLLAASSPLLSRAFRGGRG
ncbi:MAG: hypothetical protein ABJ382_01125 [Ilumatobacter sp.]